MALESSESVYRYISLIFSTFEGQRVGQVQPVILFSLFIVCPESRAITEHRCQVIYPRVDCLSFCGVIDILSRKIDMKHTVQLGDLRRGHAPCWQGWKLDSLGIK